MDCPRCGTPGAYVGLNEVECPNPECAAYKEPDVEVPQSMTEQQMLEYRALARWHVQALAAKGDPARFASAVMLDEKKRTPIVLAPMHHRWHAAVAPPGTRTVLFAPREFGKTSFTVSRVLWEIGRDRNVRIALVSNTARQAQKVLSAVKQIIERSERFRAVFPEVRRGPDDVWTQAAITVERDPAIRDPTVQALGWGGPVLGSRLDLVVVDDVLDFENTRTPDQREKLVEWFDSVIFNLVLREGRFLVVGTPWHPEDLMHVLAKRDGWQEIRDPAIVDGEAQWPERWDLEALEQKRASMTPLEWGRQLMCIARSDEASRFREEWILKCKKRALASGVTSMVERWGAGAGHVITGVDLGIGLEEKHDQTVFFTIAVMPEGSRRILNIASGRWTAPQIRDIAVAIHRRYGGIMVVENNQAQEHTRQWIAHETHIPVKAYTTGRAKAHPEFGVESIAVEMENGKWLIPCDDHLRCHPEVQEWVNECLYYSPNTHVGDRLMACFFAQNYARQLGSVGVVSGVNMMQR